MTKSFQRPRAFAERKPTRQWRVRASLDLITMQRYMHFSPATIEDAIRLLDRHGPAEVGHYATHDQRPGDQNPGVERIGDGGSVIRYLQSLR